MEPDKKDVVGEQHEAGPFISKPAFTKRIVSEITDVLDLGVLHDIFVHSDGRNPEEDSGAHHSDYARHPAEDGERPRLGHDSKANLVPSEQPSCLLPGHSSKLDLM